MRKDTTVTVERDLVKRAHEIGLNASNVCNKALKNKVELLEQSNKA